MMDSKKNQPETRQIENQVGDHKQAAVDFLERAGSRRRTGGMPRRMAGTTTRISGQVSRRCKKGCRRITTSSRTCGLA
jgi:hypothetical protein